MIYVALLRGINVSGKNSIKMSDLTALMLALKFKQVRTYIQSGNIVFTDDAKDKDKLEAKIKTAILKTFGLSVPVLVIEASTFIEVVQMNPYLKSKTDTEFLHVTLLSEIPQSERINTLLAGDYGTSTFKYLGNTLYLYTPDGYGKTKLSNTFIENKLKVNATTRNWKTMLALQKMLNTTP